jgi:hypothetical protein
LARPARHCSEEFPDAAAVLPEALRREAERMGPLTELRSVRAAARVAVPAGPHQESEMPAQRLAHPSAAAARTVRALQVAMQPVAGLQPAEPRAALRLEEPAVRAAAAAEVPRVPQASAVQPRAARVAQAVRDAVAVPQRGAAPVAEVRPPEEEAVPDVVAAALPQAAVRAAGVAVRLRGAEQDAAAQQQAAARDEARGVLLLAAVWAAPLCLQEARLAPSARARSARARESLRTGQL